MTLAKRRFPGTQRPTGFMANQPELPNVQMSTTAPGAPPAALQLSPSRSALGAAGSR